jgi:DNA-binding MarR family transcriptional regulator
MVTILGTLGFRPETLIPTIKSTEGLNTVVAFHSDHERSISATAEIQKLCEMMGIEFVHREIPDAFDFMKVASSIQKEIEALRNKGETIAVFNIAGGTRIMSACALMMCTIEGLNSVYVHDETLEEIPLPLLHIRYSDVLTDMQKKILRYLLDNRGRSITQVELASSFNMHKATVNHHIKMLVEKGAVHLETNKADSREKLVRVEDSMGLILRP